MNINNNYDDQLKQAKLDLENAEFNLKIARENYNNLHSREGIEKMIKALYPVPNALLDKIKK